MLLNPNNSFKLKIEIEHSQASIVSVQLGFFFFFFFPFCWQPVDVEQWWRSNGKGEREREIKCFWV